MKTIKITDDFTIKTSELMTKHREQFDSWCYWSNKELDKYFLPPLIKTVREFNFSESPDVLNKSWNDLKDQNEQMTFREYIIFFEAYYKETGDYPDRETLTFFKDALPDGHVAHGYWDPSSLRPKFCWYGPRDCDPSVGARLAISLNSSPLSLESRIEELEAWRNKMSEELIKLLTK